MYAHTHGRDGRNTGAPRATPDRYPPNRGILAARETTEENKKSLGSLLSSTSISRASHFIRAKGVASSTGEAYVRAWQHWSEFHVASRSTDLFLESVENNDTAKSIVWTMFCMYLYDHGKRAEQIYSILSGVRHQLVSRFTSVKFLANETVTNARRAVQRNPDEERLHAESKREREKLPVTRDMLANLRSHLWSNDADWSFEAIQRKAVWLACCLSFDRGPRIGNLSLKNGRASLDHNIRCSNASFLVLQGSEMVRTVAAGPEMRNVAPEEVQSLTIEMVTSKTTGRGKALKILPAVISNNSDESSQLLQDFVAFVQHSGAENDDPLLSFYRTSALTGKRMLKVLTRKEITREVKACAVRYGLPSNLFSANSLRKGHATQTSMGGMAKRDRNIAGGWAPDSSVPDKHYDHSKRLHGALDAAASVGARRMSVQQLRALVPAASKLA